MKERLEVVVNSHAHTNARTHKRTHARMHTRTQKQVLDERVQSVVFRVEEFKQQLDHMHQNITSCSDKMQEVYEHMQQLKELFQRIDQVEVGCLTLSQKPDQPTPT